MSKLQFKDVAFRFSESDRDNFIENLSITFDSDKISIITGPSGSGKSTILNLAAGIYPKNAGSIHQGKILIDDIDINELTPEERAPLVSMMFQNPDLQFCMDTVENEILFCLGNLNIPREKMMKIVDVALDFCGISDLRHRTLHSLSGGEKQKAMLACIVAINPKWLLLDEPFANVDEQSAKELVNKLVELHKKGTGIIVVDHRLDYWLPVADEIRLMDRVRGLQNEVFIPSELSDGQLLELGILPPNNRYKHYQNKNKHNDNKPLLDIENLTVTRGNKPIISGLNYQFQQNKIYAILGKSGSGKSTLFGALTGLYKYKGKIRLEGKDIKKRAIRKTGKIGFVMQNPLDQFVADTVLEEILVGLPKENQQNIQAEKILREIGLWPFRNFSPYMLSQGQQRRLAVLALLSYDCKVLICDEPSYAQDWKNTVAIMDNLTETIDKRNMTLIFSTHDHKLAFDYADVVLVLEEGRLVEFNQSGMQNDRHFDSYTYIGSGT